MESAYQHHYGAPPPHRHHHHHCCPQPSLNPYHPHHIPNPSPNPYPSPIPGHRVIPPDPDATHGCCNGFYASSHACQCPPPAAAAAALPSGPHYPGEAGRGEQRAALKSFSSAPMQLFATQENPQHATMAGVEDSKKPVEVGALYCSVCEIVCNSQDSLNTHNHGKQHKKKLQKLQELTTGISINNLYCQVCDIVCNKQDILNNHKQGKSHMKKLQKLQESITPSPNGISCEVCAIVCSSKNDLKTHQQGKKHNEHLKKLEEPMMTNVQNGATSVVSQDKVVGKQPKKIAIPVTNDYLESEKQNLLDCKIPEDEIRVCTLCSVVFHDHMAGQKHAAMLKQQQSNSSVTTKPTDAVDDAPVTSEDSKDKHPYKRAAPATEDDLKTKKRNILGCGGNEDLVRECTICNVVCNSQISFVSHMAGSKHAMVVNKKQHQQAPVNSD